MSDYGFDYKLAELHNQRIADYTANPADFWPVCRALEHAGLLRSNAEDVAVAKIGPFTVATQFDKQEAADMFVRFLAENAIESIAEQHLDKVAALNLLLLIAELFAGVFSKGTIFHDETAWTVLISIKRQNALGHTPDEKAIVEQSGLAFDDVTRSLEFLTGRRLLSGSPLVTRTAEGFTATV